MYLVKVHSATTGETKVFEGTAMQILQQIMTKYSFLKRYPVSSLGCALQHLARQQNFFVEITGDRQ